MFIQVLINGITLGMLYSLIAVGYSMVFSILGIVNFSHGSIFMAGSIIAEVLYIGVGLHYIPAFIIAALSSALLGILLEKFAIRPIRDRNISKSSINLACFISTIGVGLIIETAVLAIYGPRTQPLPFPFEVKLLKLLGLNISNADVLIALVSILLLLVLQIFLKRTRFGTAIRATSQNIESAKLMGVNVNRVTSTTFAIGSFLGAVSGILVGMYFNSVYPTMGAMAGIKGYAAAVVGGIGNLYGAVIGGIIIGIAENMGSFYILASLKDAMAFLILVIVMLVKPQGLFTKFSDKV